MKDWVLEKDDGDKIGILELGDLESDNVIFYFHGFPGCRMEARLADRTAKKLNLHVIALDRPGYGNSTYKENRQITDFPATLKFAADKLQIKTFSILGVSGGTSYALACVVSMPERIKKVSIVSGMAPLNGDNVFKDMTSVNKFILKLGSFSPRMASALVAVVAFLWYKSTFFMQLWLKTFMSHSDKNLIKKNKDSSAMGKMNREALKQGSKGVRRDFELLCYDWNSILEQVNLPVVFWHGNDDCYVPIAMGRYNAKKVKNSSFKEVDGAGHLMVIENLEEILAQYC